MANKEICGPWIKWHGGECPVMRDQKVMVKLRSGVVRGPGRAVSYMWAHYGDGSDIIEYCTVAGAADATLHKIIAGVEAALDAAGAPAGTLVERIGALAEDAARWRAFSARAQNGD